MWTVAGAGTGKGGRVGTGTGVDTQLLHSVCTYGMVLTPRYRGEGG